LADSHKAGFRVVHYSLQGDHLHLVVEAHGRVELARGMQGLGIRLAKRMNARLGRRRGHVLADRYHARVLGTPTEVRRALLYVLNNARHHAAQASCTYPASWLDPYSSAACCAGWRDRPPDAPTCTAPPRAWLLTRGWRRRGLLDSAAVPGSTPPPA